MLKINSFPSTLSSDIHFLPTLLQFSPQKFHVNVWQRAVTALTRRRWYTVISPQKWRGAEPLLVKSTNSSALGLAPQDVPSTRHRAWTHGSYALPASLLLDCLNCFQPAWRGQAARKTETSDPPDARTPAQHVSCQPHGCPFLPSSQLFRLFFLLPCPRLHPTQTNICIWLLLSKLGLQACLFIYLFIYLLIYLFIGRLADWKKADKSKNVRATALEFKAQSNYNKEFACSEIKSLFKLQHCVAHPSYHWAMVKVNERPYRLPLGHAHSRCIGFLLELKWNSFCIAALLDI